MAFPSVVYTANNSAASGLVSNSAAAGLDVSGLSAIAQLQSVVANLLLGDPSTVVAPAGDVASGTFGANLTPPDTGTYAFPGAVNIAGVLAVQGASLTLSLAGAAFALQGTTTALTANATSGAITVKGNVGTGTGAVGGIVFQVPVTHGSDSVAQTLTTVLTLSATTVVAATFGGALAITGALSGVTTLAVSTSATVTSASAVALAVGLAGATNPAFVVDSSTAVQAAGLKVTGATAAGNVALAVISSGAAANLTIDAKSTGTIQIGGTSSGNILLGTAVVLTQAGAFSAITTLATTGAITGAAATGHGFGTAPRTDRTLNIGRSGAADTFATITRSGNTQSAGIEFYSGATKQWSVGAYMRTDTTGLEFDNGTAVIFSLQLAGTAQFGGALTVNAATTLGTAAGTDLTTIGGTGYGAGVASIRLNGLSTAAVNNQVGTLTNAPVAGNPNFWIPISIAGTVRYLPAW